MGRASTRREALRRGAVSVAAASVTTRGVLGGEGAAPSEKLNVAFVGAGGQSAFSQEGMAGHHHREWVAACKGGPEPLCSFQGFASALTEVMLLGDLALRCGGKIEWDAEKMAAKGNPEADRVIRRDYRKGWGI